VNVKTDVGGWNVGEVRGGTDSPLPVHPNRKTKKKNARIRKNGFIEDCRTEVYRDAESQEGRLESKKKGDKVVSEHAENLLSGKGISRIEGRQEEVWEARHGGGN